MGDDLYKDFLKHYSPQFGEIAVGPLSEGMAAALPFCDDFLPAHNVETLRAFGRHLLAVTQD